MVDYSEVIADIQWINKNYLSLQEKYPNKYIVVKNGSIIVVADDYDTAYDRALLKIGDKHKFTVERIEVGDLFAYYSGLHSKDNIR